jgi:hypothetical protein
VAVINIQGIECSYRDLRDGEEILYSEYDKEDQYFRREVVPFSDEETDELAAIYYEERKNRYSHVQLAWVEREEKRMTYGEGVYAYINGTLTYIPASYWAYVNYWTLEHDEKPDYREADRIFFVFMEYICFETQVLSVTRGKGRRQGATSIGYFWLWWVCGRNPNKKGGSISYNDTIAGNNFSEMFLHGFRSLPICFIRDIDSKSESYVSFRKPDDKAKKGTVKKKDGLNSYVDYLPNSVNSYDGGKSSMLLLDESGKYEKTNVNTYWSKVSPTLKTGRTKVGFAYMPTTVNPAPKGGGNYKQFWEEANQNAINPTTGQPYGLKTPHKVVRYFVPATEGYLGCIDKYGNSVVDDPAEPIMGNDGILITEGSRSVILGERALKKGEQLMEHRRDFPLDEFDMFSFTTGVCEFNQERIIAQMNWLRENQPFLRQCRFYRDKEKKKSIYTDKEEVWDITRYMDDNAGEWLLLEEPEKKNLYDHRGKKIPLNTLRYSIGVDTIKSGFSSDGSTATICVFKKSHIVEGEEKGLYPVAIYMGKPRLMAHLYENVLLACMFYGCKVNFEIDAGSGYYDYFLEKDSLAFLEWTPRVAIDVTKKHPLIKPGTESANPYQFAMQLEVCKKFIDGTLIDGYNGNVHRVMFPMLLQQLLEYNHSDRTKSDLCISLMMALLPCFGSTDYLPNIETKPKSLLPTYKLKMPA